MFKAIIISILIIVFSIQHLNASCPDTELYCFDINNHRLGKISVGQCWRWHRLSCQPCSANVMEKQITFFNYIHYCRYFFPDTVRVLDTKKVWNYKMLHIWNSVTFGK